MSDLQNVTGCILPNRKPIGGHDSQRQANNRCCWRNGGRSDPDNAIAVSHVDANKITGCIAADGIADNPHLVGVTRDDNPDIFTGINL